MKSSAGRPFALGCRLNQEPIWASNRLLRQSPNSSTGRIWVVQDDYGVARVEFEMVKPVRFWGGIIGTLRNMTGRLEFTRVTSGVWLPDTIDIKIDLRILTRNIRRRIVSAWDEYIPLNIVN